MLWDGSVADGEMNRQFRKPVVSGVVVCMAYAASSSLHAASRFLG